MKFDDPAKSGGILASSTGLGKFFRDRQFALTPAKKNPKII
jgi:hypothetical protein